MNKINKKLKNYLPSIVGLSLYFYYHSALAATGGQSLATISNRVQTNILAVVKLLIIISYLAGVGFAMAGILQFKAHKDNPQQTPLSKPVVYIAVAGFLLFLPSLMKTTGKTIFGDNSGPTGKDEVVDISSVSAATPDSQ
jgi:intracellular multiplication protein IcmD